MSDQTYNGWTNQQTWELWVRISNNHLMYLSWFSLARKFSEEKLLQALQVTYSGEEYSEVNFQEIAKQLKQQME
jgi:hypothetical protein